MLQRISSKVKPEVLVALALLGLGFATLVFTAVSQTNDRETDAATSQTSVDADLPNRSKNDQTLYDERPP